MTARTDRCHSRQACRAIATPHAQFVLRAPRALRSQPKALAPEALAHLRQRHDFNNPVVKHCCLAWCKTGRAKNALPPAHFETRVDVSHSRQIGKSVRSFECRGCQQANIASSREGQEGRRYTKIKIDLPVDQSLHGWPRATVRMVFKDLSRATRSNSAPERCETDPWPTEAYRKGCFAAFAAFASAGTECQGDFALTAKIISNSGQ